MPDYPLPGLPPVEPPPNNADHAPAQQRAGVRAGVAALRGDERGAELPRSTAAQWADQLVDLARQYIRYVIGDASFVQRTERGRVTSIDDRRARRCTMTLEGSGPTPRVQYDPTPPTVGGQYVARRTVRLVGESGPPVEVQWSIKVSGRLWLYWFDNGVRHPGQDTLCRTIWPLAVPPFGDTDPVEELWSWPKVVGTRHYGDTVLLAIDGQGTVIARRAGQDRSIANFTRSLFTCIAHGPLVPPTLPAPAPLLHDVPKMFDVRIATTTTTFWLLNPFACGWRPADEPGVVCGVWVDQFDPLLDPITGLDTAGSLPYLSYYTSRDYGATWQRIFRLPYQPTHVGLDPDNPLFGPALLTNLYYAEAGRGFAWVVADEAEAAALGTAVGGTAFLAGVSSLRGALAGPFFHHGGAGYPADLGAVNQAGHFYNWMTLPDQRLGSAATLMLGGAGSGGRILRAAPHAVWLETETGPGGAFTSWHSGHGDNTQVEVIGLDRGFTQAVVVTQDLDTGALLHLVVTEDGEHWENLPAAQQAAWAPILFPHSVAVHAVIRAA